MITVFLQLEMKQQHTSASDGLSPCTYSPIRYLLAWWKINQSPIFFIYFFVYQMYTVWRCCLPGLMWPRRPLPENYLNSALPHRLPYRSIASDPDRAAKPLWTVDKRHPALGCKATVNLQSKNITATAGCPQLSGRVACRPCISHNSFVRHETGLTT